jgi:hypothetical protein
MAPRRLSELTNDIRQNVSMLDFSQTKALIEAGYAAACRETCHAHLRKRRFRHETE